MPDAKIPNTQCDSEGPYPSGFRASRSPKSQSKIINRKSGRGVAPECAFSNSELDPDAVRRRGGEAGWWGATRCPSAFAFAPVQSPVRFPATMPGPCTGTALIGVQPCWPAASANRAAARASLRRHGLRTAPVLLAWTSGKSSLPGLAFPAPSTSLHEWGLRPATPSAPPPSSASPQTASSNWASRSNSEFSGTLIQHRGLLGAVLRVSTFLFCVFPSVASGTTANFVHSFLLPN